MTALEQAILDAAAQHLRPRGNATGPITATDHQAVTAEIAQAIGVLEDLVGGGGLAFYEGAGEPPAELGGLGTTAWNETTGDIWQKLEDGTWKHRYTVPNGQVQPGGNAEFTIDGITEFRDRFGASETGNAEYFFKKLLSLYQAPAVVGFTFMGISSQTVEEDTPFAGATRTFAWATSNASNVAPGSLKLRDVTGNADLATGLANDGTEDVAVAGFTAALGESRRYRVSGTNTQGGVFSADLIISGSLSLLYGVSVLSHAQMLAAIAAQPLTDARVAELGFSKELAGGRAKNYNYNCSGGRYIHVLHDARISTSRPSVQQGPNNFSAFDYSAVSGQNKYSVARNYRLLSTDLQTAASFNLNILG